MLGNLARDTRQSSHHNRAALLVFVAETMTGT